MQKFVRGDGNGQLSVRNIQAEPVQSKILNGRYEVFGPLIKRGNCDVYTAFDLNTATEVDISVRSAAGNDPRERFELGKREANVLRNMTNQGVHERGARVPIFLDTFENGLDTCIVTSRVPGMTLEAYRAADGGLANERQFENVMRQLLHTLTVIHSLLPPVIHRNLGPESIVIDPTNGMITITNFGNVLSQRSEGHTVIAEFVREQDPKLSEGENSTVVVDILAAGVICNWLFNWFKSGKLTSKERAFIEKSMNEKPDKRFQTAQEMLTAFEAIAKPVQTVAQVAIAPRTDQVIEVRVINETKRELSGFDLWRLHNQPTILMAAKTAAQMLKVADELKIELTAERRSELMAKAGLVKQIDNPTPVAQLPAGANLAKRIVLEQQGAGIMRRDERGEIPDESDPAHYCKVIDAEELRRQLAKIGRTADVTAIVGSAHNEDRRLGQLLAQITRIGPYNEEATLRFFIDQKIYDYPERVLNAIQAGGALNIALYGNTPLMQALQRLQGQQDKSIKVAIVNSIEIMLEAGANPFWVNNEGKGALTIGAYCGIGRVFDARYPNRTIATNDLFDLQTYLDSNKLLRAIGNGAAVNEIRDDRTPLTTALTAYNHNLQRLSDAKEDRVKLQANLVEIGRSIGYLLGNCANPHMPIPGRQNFIEIGGDQFLA